VRAKKDMRILLYILLAIVLMGCRNKADETYSLSDKNSANFTVAVVHAFSE
jgi:PBP1b-binding outer membrane lipoprotein LpoB